MAYFIIFVALLSVIVIFYIEIHWRSLMKQTLVTEEVVVRRKRIKYVEVFWMIIFAVTALYSYEIITGEEISGLSSVVIVGIFFGWNRTIFEPYYTTDVIDGLDNYSLTWTRRVLSEIGMRLRGGLSSCRKSWKNRCVVRFGIRSGWFMQLATLDVFLRPRLRLQAYMRTTVAGNRLSLNSRRMRN